MPCSAKDAESLAASNGGERQAWPTLRQYSHQHVARYTFAARAVRYGDVVLDLGCGVGYGSAMIADSEPGARIIALDNSPLAVAYGRKYFGRRQIIRLQDDAFCLRVGGFFDVVVALEFVEHIEDADRLFRYVAAILRGRGRFVLSTPNQAVLPHDPARWPFHVRHYRQDEIAEGLRCAGFHLGPWHHTVSRSREVYLGADKPMVMVCATKEPAPCPRSPRSASY